VITSIARQFPFQTREQLVSQIAGVRVSIFNRRPTFEQSTDHMLIMNVEDALFQRGFVGAIERKR
jgi:hypothetical protein